MQDYKDIIKTMIENGFSIRKIYTNLKLSPKEVLNMIELNKWAVKKEQFDLSKIDYICSLYKEGVSAKQLGFKYGIAKLRVQKWAAEKGYLRNKSDSLRFTKINQNIFDVIDAPAKAYWLGFFYADAHNSPKISTFSMCLKAEDHDHLVTLAKFMGLEDNKVIKGFIELNGKQFPTSTVKLYSKHICETMIKHGCPPAKSFIIKYPAWLDEALHSHFIRGLFDGDGCLTFRSKQREWKWGLVSTKEGCESIKNLLLKHANVSVTYDCISDTGNNTYNLTTGGNEKIRRLMDWLYTDTNDSIRLARKYKKYEQLADQQDNRQIGRKNYNIQEVEKQDILSEIKSGQSSESIATSHNIHVKTVEKIKDSVKV